VGIVILVGRRKTKVNIENSRGAGGRSFFIPRVAVTPEKGRQMLRGDGSGSWGGKVVGQNVEGY